MTTVFKVYEEEDRMVRKIDEMCKEIDRLDKQGGERVVLDQLLVDLELLLEEFKAYRDAHGLR